MKIQLYEQVTPDGLYTTEALEALGMAVTPGQRPAALLRVRRPAYERLTGVYRLDQTEPLTRGLSA